MMKNRSNQARQVFTILKAGNPTPTTELNYTTPFELLVSVVLSAQATDVGVNKATAKLYQVANTPVAILALGILGLEPYIKTIGLYRTKAKNVIGLCAQLIKEHAGIVPDNFDALVKLPGVGRKTANVVLNTLFGHHVIAVDTHIFRVSNRLGLTNGKNVLEVENQLQKVIPAEFKQDAHHWLILHGRYVCKARSPQCAICSLKQHCDYYQNVIASNAKCP
jgi:endonuclease-3